MSQVATIQSRHAANHSRLRGKAPADLFHRRELALSVADNLMSIGGQKEVMQGVPTLAPLSTTEIDAALDGLAAKEIIWHGLGFAFEEQRYASWILAMDPAADFQVEFDESSMLDGERPGLTAPALLS